MGKLFVVAVCMFVALLIVLKRALNVQGRLVSAALLLSAAIVVLQTL